MATSTPLPHAARPHRWWRRPAAAALLAALLAAPAAAQDETWQLTGYLAPEVRVAAGANNDGVWQSSAKPDLHAELRAYPTTMVDGQATLEADFQFNGTTSPRLGFDVPELWVRVYTGPYSFAVGRHLFNWGVIGDYGVADPLNPQDLVDTGEIWTERKEGVWSMVAAWDLPSMSIQGVVIPVRHSAEIPADGPYVGNALPPAVLRSLGLAAGATAPTRAGLSRDEPPIDLEHTQAGARLYIPHEVGDFFVAVAGLLDQTGTIRPEPGAPAGAVVAFPRLGTFSVGGMVPFLEGFSVAAETMAVITEDRDGSDPFIRNPSIQTAVQLKGWLSPRLQFEVGLLDEQLLLLDDGAEARDERALAIPVGSPFFNVDAHLLHTGFFYRFGDAMHRVAVAYIVAYERDGHALNPELDFRLVEGMRLRFGGQFFAGPEGRSIGALEPFSNVYLAFRADF